MRTPKSYSGMQCAEHTTLLQDLRQLYAEARPVYRVQISSTVFVLHAMHTAFILHAILHAVLSGDKSVLALL